MIRPWRIVLSVLVGLLIAGGVLYVTTPDKADELPTFARNQAPEFAKYGGILKISSRAARCTAFVIGTRYAITAGHCTSRPWWKFGYGERDTFKVEAEGVRSGVELRVVRAGSDPDYALLTGDLTEFKTVFANFNRTDLLMNIGATYLVCGYPMGNKSLLCNPFVSKANDGFSVVGYGPVVPGMSGGPVINLTTGAVEGVVHGVVSNLTIVDPIIGALDGSDVLNNE